MDDSELLVLRIARCGCMIPADARPTAHAFKTTRSAMSECRSVAALSTTRREMKWAVVKKGKKRT